MPCEEELAGIEWSDDFVDIQVDPQPGIVFHVRLQGDELARFDEMLTKRDPDMLMSDFLHTLALESIERWEAEREPAGAD